MERISDRRMRVLRVAARITETSGAYNQYSLALTHKHDITICTYYSSHLSPSPEIAYAEGDGSRKTFFQNIDAAVKRTDFDVLHAHSPLVALLVLLANKKLDRPLPPTVVTVDNSYQNFSRRNKLMLGPVFAWFRRVVCCSHACRSSFPLFYQNLAGKRLDVVPNGVDLTRIDQALAGEDKNVAQTSFTVASVGRLRAIKNPETVLRAFHKVAEPGSRLVFIGEGDQREPLNSEANARGLSAQCRLTGLIPRDDVFRMVSRADLFVSASRGEGLPVAVLEAMACGCPVVLSDIPPHRDIADQVDFIPLVHPDDVHGFAREIGRLQSMDARQRATLGERCREHVEQAFSLSAMHQGYDRVYADAINERRGRRAA